MIDVLLATGIRVSSLVDLHVEDVDLDAERLWIRTKGARRLRVALPRALGERLVAGVVEGPLFRSRLGTRLGARTVQLRLAGWVAEAGIREGVSPHALRHTCATRMYRETKDLRRVQVVLGHRSVMTTERYVGV